MHLLVYALTGLGMVFLLCPRLEGHTPSLGGNAQAGFWAALACAVLMVLYRTVARPRRIGQGHAEEATLGANRRELFRELAVSLALQAALPLAALSLVGGQDVLPLFAPLRGAGAGMCVVAACVVATLLFPPRAADTGRRSARFYGALAVLPYFVLRAGVPEELLFRGCLQTTAVSAFGPAPGIALCTAVFAIGHVCQAFRLKRAGVIDTVPWGLVLAAVLVEYIPIALMFALLWHVTGSLWACVVLHAWIDAVYLGRACAAATGKV